MKHNNKKKKKYLSMDTESELFLQLKTFISTHSSEEMVLLGRQELQIISKLLSPSAFTYFLILKNIKRFGGINEYMNDFFLHDTVNGTLKQNLPIDGVKCILQTVQTIPEINLENQNRIKRALEII